MKPPVVAILGRPNVGKSTLFNVLVRRRISIEEPTAGVTRDRVSTRVTTPGGAEIELVDTGGMGGPSGEPLVRNIDAQIRYAVEQAAVLVLVVDGSAGLVPQDRGIAAKLRAAGKPIVLVANKVESVQDSQVAPEFGALGLGEPILVSALHRRNTGALRDLLFDLAGGAAPVGPTQPEMKIAVVGQRNVGKSTLINALAREERVIVSELPGTTRDSVDVRFERDGHVVLAIDTAGVRRKRRVSDAIEFYSRVRSEESIRRADVVLLLLDPLARISQVDKHLAEYISDHYKPSILVVNKWDLVKGKQTTAAYAKYIGLELPRVAYAPISVISALENRGVQRTIDLAASLWNQARVRVATPRLNDAIERLKTQPQVQGNIPHRPKIYYATQVGVAPPTFVLFVNNPKSFSPDYRRFIAGFLRKNLPFHEVPVAVRYRQASRRER